MTTVVGASIYPNSAAALRLRVSPVIDVLRRRGVDATVWSFLRDGDLDRWLSGRSSRVAAACRGLESLPSARRWASTCEALLLQREALPLDSLLLEKAVLRRKRPIIWDVDDALWLRSAPGRQFVRGRASKYEFLARHASEVWAGNRTVADWATRTGASKVEIVPTTVEVPPMVDHHVREDDLLVWIGTPSTGPFIEKLLRELGPDLEGWRVLVVGARVQAPSSLTVEQSSWSPEAEVKALRRATVGLYPLDLAHPAVLGKSALKCVLYMANGIPVVATPTPSNLAVMADGVEGFFAQAAEEWLDRLSLLREDVLRQRIATAGHRRALRDFDTRTWGVELARRIEGYL